jgi:hypothetical protein
LRPAFSISEQTKQNKNYDHMVLLRITSEERLFLGLDLTSFSSYTIRRNEKKMNLDRFKDSFYASPQTSENIFVDIQDEDLANFQTRSNYFVAGVVL